MVQEILDCKPPFTEEEFAEVELLFGHPFPERYKTFLEMYNGGYPVPDCFSFDKEDASTVDRFLCIGSAEDDNLRTYLKRYRDRVADGFLPIAKDPGGNLIVIGVSPAYVNQIFFWDHEFEAEEGMTANMQNMSFVANSLDDFLEGLYELEI